MNHSKLIDLYARLSKHSHYQLLATPLREFIPAAMRGAHSRYEKERLDFILEHLDARDITIADIGGNTGYFTLELIYRGAKSAMFIEGNKTHSDFLLTSLDLLGWSDRVQVYPYYLTFEKDLSSVNADITLLLNVLHHVGDDYGDHVISTSTAKSDILRSLSRLAKHTRKLVFQLGFNWKGKKDLPLFKNGTKSELIDFIQSGTQDNWIIEHIGIAETKDGHIIYNELNSNNIKRQDSLGEFLNRPLFIMRSKFYNGCVTTRQGKF